jgi:hypothetical protein
MLPFAAFFRKFLRPLLGETHWLSLRHLELFFKASPPRSMAGFLFSENGPEMEA